MRTELERQTDLLGFRMAKAGIARHRSGDVFDGPMWLAEELSGNPGDYPQVVAYTDAPRGWSRLVAMVRADAKVKARALVEAGL